MRLTLAACGLVAAIAWAQPMSGTYPVGPGGPGVDSFPTVQAAAAALSARGLAGDADFPIRQFVYTGAVTVRSVAGSDRFLTRFFASGAGAIIDAAGGRHGFAVESTANVTVQGLRLRGCRDTGTAFLRFTASDNGVVRSCRLEDSAQFGVQVIGSDSFRAESLRQEGDLLGPLSRALDFRNCRYAFATRCSVLGQVGNGLWMEGGGENGSYRVVVMDASGHGLHVEDSPMASIHNFRSLGSTQYAGYFLDSPFAMLESCVFQGASQANAHFERCESLHFDMAMGIGDARRSVAVINSPYSKVMGLSVMGSPGVGLYIKGSPECHAESTQYAGFQSDTCIGVVVDSSDCTMFKWLQVYGRLGRGVSVRKSSDVKIRHARMELTAAEAGIYLEQADRFAVEPCSLSVTGTTAAVLLADSSANDSLRRMTILGTPQSGVLARGSRGLVVANCFVTGWSVDGVRLEGGRSSELYYNTVKGRAGGTGAAARIEGTADVRALDNILASPGGDSSACWSISGAWPFRAAGVDHNDLFASDRGSAGRFNDTLYRALADWRGLPGAPDLSSIAADPLFAADTDCHITSGSPCRAAGTPVSGFEFDIDSDERDPATPDIGADEYVPPAVAERPPGLAPAGLRLEQNPVAGQVALRYSLSVDARVRFTVRDVSGRALLEQDAGPRRAGTHIQRLDLGVLVPGVYLLELGSAAGCGTVKLVRPWR
ncbi:MAG: NosD domain-containing protein [bacterium]